jgi:acyl carrier protein
VGEIYIGGGGVARGYLGRPSLTAERFIPDPFSSKPGARMYRSGDLGRYRDDGSIDFLGRIDHQVKVRGFRIELGEVEAALSSCPGVHQAVVIARPDGAGSQRLVAYVVGGESSLSVRGLRLSLAEVLPDYMIPSAFIELDELPLTPNGKIDRKALPEPELTRSQAGTAYRPPKTPEEEGLCEIWQEVLGLDEVGVEDDFFSIGGHSLLAIQVVSRARSVFGVELPIRVLFELRTIRAIAEELRSESRTVEGVQIPVAPRSGRLPLSFAQSRLWFLDQLEGASPAYNIPMAYRLRGSVDPSRLEGAFKRLVERHEPLRTVFHEEDGAAYQQVREDADFRLTVIELSEEQDLAALVEQEAARPFDLAQDLMLRGTLVRLGTEEHLLLVTLHHIASDGWSVGIFNRELSQLYNDGDDTNLPALPVQYVDYSQWQQQWAPEELDEQLGFWKEYLAGAPAVLDLPTDFSRPARQSYEGHTHRFELSEELTQGLERLSQESGTTLFMTLLTGFAIVLHRYSGQDDIVVGCPVANRPRQELEDLIGFFVNSLPIRLDLSGAPSVEEMLGRTKQSALQAYVHQTVPFEKIVEAVQPERDLSRSPIFQVMFDLQHGEETTPQL